MDYQDRISYKGPMERRTRIYLVRHGQVEGHENHPVYGHTDLGLSQVGRCQMERLRERMEFLDLAVVFTSDLKRSIQSARILIGNHDIRIIALRELRELYLGEWEGLTLEELRQRYAKELEERQRDILNFRPPGGGESISELRARVKPCLERILEEYRGKDIAIVGHGAVNRLIVADLLGMDLRELYRIHQDYGCLNVIDIYDGWPVVRLLNG